MLRTEQYQDDHDTASCKRIWCAVLLQAIEDLFRPRRSGDNSMTVEQIRQSAENYLFSDDSDYAFEIFGIDGDTARVALLKRMGAM